MKWEYLVLEIGITTSIEIVDMFNELGKEEWELIFIEGGVMGSVMVAYFKRLLPTKSSRMVFSFSDQDDIKENLEVMISEMKRAIERVE